MIMTMLQLDITKLIVLQPKREFPAKDKRKLLQILWSTIQMLYADDWSEVLNEVNRLGAVSYTHLTLPTT